jgi:TetR/AcrR family transcriptional regulator, transcriptional repressor for nem operon
MANAKQPRKRRDPDNAREALLDAAFDEMYLNGFNATGIEMILAASGMSKGALYHHFGNKQRLGYAVVEERVKPLVRERYLQPFRESADPPEALRRMGRKMEEELRKTGILKRGCPLNNLIQEMSGVDDGFRKRLAAILEEWRDTIAKGLRDGQASGTVHRKVDPDGAATFIVAALMGAVGFAKNAQTVLPFDACRKALDSYVETLRPRLATPA